jgi:Transglutaminase-like superfamily
MNPELEFYASHSPFTDPGHFAPLLRTLPDKIPALCKALQGIVLHYVASGIEFTPQRLEQIDSRRVERILSHLESGTALDVPRALEACFVGCCRDFATLFVAAMRERGVPARTRIGFAPYLRPNFNHDHVVAEFWNGSRWVMVDPQIPPEQTPFDIQDMPTGAFVTASSAWQQYRSGAINPDLYGVGPHLHLKGPWFLRNYVMLELAALNKVETLLWDGWGEMHLDHVGDAARMDHASSVMLSGNWTAIRDLYETTPELQVPAQVTCFSPTGKTRLESLAI